MNQHVIDSERIILAQLGDEHCGEQYVGWLNDPEINRFLETRFSGVQNTSMVQEFVRSINDRDNEHLFGIFMKDNNRHIGNIKLGPINPHHSVGDVSLFLGDRSVWGMGLATEAITAITRFAFQTMNLRKAAASMYAPNQGSYRAFLKAGYREEGRRVDHYILDGVPCDLILLGLTRSQFMMVERELK